MSGKNYLWAGLLLAVEACGDSKVGGADMAVPDLAPAVSCSDGVKNGGEGDIDCGGPCAPCADGRSCTAWKDCASNVCSAAVCAAPSCTDKVKNGGETDLDCGGTCPGCGEGLSCSGPSDCGSGVCSAQRCAAASCTDTVKNGNETDTDCGGACKPCSVGQTCAVNADCGEATCAAKKCAYLRSCAEILAAQPTLPSGVYLIDPDGAGAETPMPAYCDMSSDGGGWTMVYKLSGGVDADIVGLWKGTAVRNEAERGFLSLSPSADHYMNRVVARYWNAGGVTLNEARYVVATGGKIAVWAQFDARGSDRLSWFSDAKITKSSYSDIKTEGKNFFSIDGDASIGRHWFVNRSYGGCPADTGWLVVDRLTDPCSWESNAPKKVAILYAPRTTYGNYNDNTIAQGEVFAVFVR